MAKRDLANSHLAELHAEAARLGVPNYRMLRREQLVEAIAERDAEEAAEAEPELEEPVEEENEEGVSEGREETEEPPREGSEEAEAAPVRGVLDLTYRGYGFLRLRGLE